LGIVAVHMSPVYAHSTLLALSARLSGPAAARKMSPLWGGLGPLHCCCVYWGGGCVGWFVTVGSAPLRGAAFRLDRAPWLLVTLRCMWGCPRCMFPRFLVNAASTCPLKLVPRLGWVAPSIRLAGVGLSTRLAYMALCRARGRDRLRDGAGLASDPAARRLGWTWWWASVVHARRPGPCAGFHALPRGP
jgi:hypothetical protein